MDESIASLVEEAKASAAAAFSSSPLSALVTWLKISI